MLLADLIADPRERDAGGAGRLRVALDGADAADPACLADALAEQLRLRGRPAIRIGARWFLRPASVRLERGHQDPDAYFDGWLDTGALRREVLDRLGPGGDGRYLPTLWDPERDRPTREGYATAPPDAVILVDGPLLLGRGLPFDLSVHLRLSPAALARRTPAEAEWTLPAFVRYEDEVRPGDAADVVIRVDDPRHPAVQLAGGA